MRKIVLLKEIPSLVENLKRNNETIVLAGGCFDILHLGHLSFLKNAKKKGTKLIILLEDDKNVRKLKGKGRPVHNQLERAKILSSVPSIDYIILLSQMKKNRDYAKLVSQIKPDVIAITSNDPYAKEKEKQAKKTGAKIARVIKRISGKSTTKLVDQI